MLDIFSPPTSGTAEVTSNSDVGRTLAESTLVQQSNENAQQVDPSRDNMLPFISDDSEIRSLLANSDSNGFKGFEDTLRDYSDTSEDGGNPSLIYGMFRNMDKFIECQRSNHGYINTPITSMLATKLPFSSAYLIPL